MDDWDSAVGTPLNHLFDHTAMQLTDPGNMDVNIRFHMIVQPGNNQSKALALIKMTDQPAVKVVTAVIQPDNWVDMVQRFANRIRKDREHITKIYYSSYGGALRQAVIRTFDRATEKYLRAIIAQYEKDYGTTLALSPIQIEYIVGYHAMALYGTLEKWFLRGMQDPVEEFLGLVQMMNTLNNYRLFKTLETLSPEVPAKE